MKPTSNPALGPEALYTKSQVYIRRGFKAQSDGDTEEYQLWASLALELLGKAALAKVHPALVADPMHYQSLFAACGRQVSPDVKTITAKTLFERLGHIDKAFDLRHQKFCEQIALRKERRAAFRRISVLWHGTGGMGTRILGCSRNHIENAG